MCRSQAKLYKSQGPSATLGFRSTNFSSCDYTSCSNRNGSLLTFTPKMNVTELMPPLTVRHNFKLTAPFHSSGLSLETIKNERLKQGSDPIQTHYYLQGYLKALEEKTTVKGYSMIRWGLALIVVAGTGIYMFREPLRDNISDEVADVAARSMGESYHRFEGSLDLSSIYFAHFSVELPFQLLRSFVQLSLILEFYNLFSGVKLSIRFVLFVDLPTII